MGRLHFLMLEDFSLNFKEKYFCNSTHFFVRSMNLLTISKSVKYGVWVILNQEMHKKKDKAKNSFLIWLIVCVEKFTKSSIYVQTLLLLLHKTTWPIEIVHPSEVSFPATGVHSFPCTFSWFFLLLHYFSFPLFMCAIRSKRDPIFLTVKNQREYKLSDSYLIVKNQILNLFIGLLNISFPKNLLENLYKFFGLLFYFLIFYFFFLIKLGFLLQFLWIMQGH
jgi:hypothetical protein